MLFSCISSRYYEFTHIIPYKYNWNKRKHARASSAWWVANSDPIFIFCFINNSEDTHLQFTFDKEKISWGSFASPPVILLTVIDIIQGAVEFLEDKKIPLRKYLHCENELSVNFHVMWFIYLLFLLLLRYPLICISPLVVRVLRHILSLTTENHLMNE